MKYIKNIIISIIILELINLGIGFIQNGKDALLPITGFNDLPLYYDMDSLYGVTRLKKTKQLINYPWGGILFETNSFGFRDDEFENDGVLVVGNSFVEGYGLRKEDRFTELLESNLNIPFNNAGSGGVWTPIQSLVLMEDLIKKKGYHFKEVLLILTPGEIKNIGIRNPSTDPNRNYPYKKNDSIVFFKSQNNSFGKKLSFTDKAKRLSKNLLVFKLYDFFKNYGTARVKSNFTDYNKENLDWLVNKFDSVDFGVKINIVIINNLMNSKLENIENYNTNRKNIFVNVIEFPNKSDYHFVCNGHLNEKGNIILAELLKPIILSN